MWIFSFVGWQLSLLRWPHILFALENFAILNYNFNSIFIGQLWVNLVYELGIFLLFRMVNLFSLVTINKNIYEGKILKSKQYNIGGAKSLKPPDPRKKEKTCSKIKVS